MIFTSTFFSSSLNFSVVKPFYNGNEPEWTSQHYKCNL